MRTKARKTQCKTLSTRSLYIIVDVWFLAVNANVQTAHAAAAGSSRSAGRRPPARRERLTRCFPLAAAREITACNTHVACRGAGLGGGSGRWLLLLACSPCAALSAHSLSAATERRAMLLVVVVLLALGGPPAAASYLGEWPLTGRASHPTCVDIPRNMSLCHDIGYHKMRLPNLLDHDTMAEVREPFFARLHVLALQMTPRNDFLLFRSSKTYSLMRFRNLSYVSINYDIFLEKNFFCNYLHLNI